MLTRERVTVQNEIRQIGRGPMQENVSRISQGRESEEAILEKGEDHGPQVLGA